MTAVDIIIYICPRHRRDLQHARGDGLLRFPDLYTRMHATTKATTFGSIFTSLAVIIYGYTCFSPSVTASTSPLPSMHSWRLHVLCSRMLSVLMRLPGQPIRVGSCHHPQWLTGSRRQSYDRTGPPNPCTARIDRFSHPDLSFQGFAGSNPCGPVSSVS